MTPTERETLRKLTAAAQAVLGSPTAVKTTGFLHVAEGAECRLREAVKAAQAVLAAQEPEPPALFTGAWKDVPGSSESAYLLAVRHSERICWALFVSCRSGHVSLTSIGAPFHDATHGSIPVNAPDAERAKAAQAWADSVIAEYEKGEKL